MRSTLSELQVKYLKNGAARYFVVVAHDGLHKLDEVTGTDANIVWQKAQTKAVNFDAQWNKKVAAQKKAAERQQAAREKEQKKALAVELTEQAQAAWAEVEQLLSATLDVDDAIDWNSLKDRSSFAEPRPSPPAAQATLPVLAFPTEPQADDPLFVDRPGFFTMLLDLFSSTRKAARVQALQQEFQAAHDNWARVCAEQRDAQEKARAELARKAAGERAGYEAVVRDWQLRRDSFKQNQDAVNAAIDADREAYKLKEAAAVEDYCDLVLENSKYPEFMPNAWELQYIADSGIVVVAFSLPNIDDLPRLKEVKYVQSRDAFDEKQQSEAAVKKAYDSALYQVALRTIHELFEADRFVNALAGVAFNGEVTRVDPATGHEVTSCILSLQVTREEFEQINLGAVDPRACFKSLKGVGSAKLHALTPVRPIMQFEKDDSRFVESYEVASTLDDGENLAMMDWEDFEHLVREVFELEFGKGGAEVKVTRASRDGGIDAVVFDPDPIRGGTIVIQAKRYTRTVGLSAVRDLFGAVMNEGANKGILVSTAAYGPDAYAFARDKPLTLLSGGELLHLLQRHGFKARIDLKEARELM